MTYGLLIAVANRKHSGQNQVSEEEGLIMVYLTNEQRPV